MASLQGFDASTVEPQKAFEVIPNGKYRAIITESEDKATKNGGGSYLQLAYQIIEEGPHKGRKLWSRHNLQNQNATAVQIAQGELSAICRAVKVLKPSDSLELHNIPLVIKVIVGKNKETDEPKNEIKGWEPVSAAGAPTGAPASGGPAPWKRTG